MWSSKHEDVCLLIFSSFLLNRRMHCFGKPLFFSSNNNSSLLTLGNADLTPTKRATVTSPLLQACSRRCGFLCWQRATSLSRVPFSVQVFVPGGKGHKELQRHPRFKDLDWDMLEIKKIISPFIPGVSYLLYHPVVPILQNVFLVGQGVME